MTAHLWSGLRKGDSELDGLRKRLIAQFLIRFHIVHADDYFNATSCALHGLYFGSKKNSEATPPLACWHVQEKNARWCIDVSPELIRWSYCAGISKLQKLKSPLGAGLI